MGFSTHHSTAFTAFTQQYLDLNSGFFVEQKLRSLNKLVTRSAYKITCENSVNSVSLVIVSR